MRKLHTPRAAAFLAAAGLALMPASGQPGSRADEVRQSNGNILRLLTVFESSSASQHANVRAQAASALAARAAALEALIRQDPATALGLAFSSEALARIAAAFPASSGLLETEGSWQGPVDYLIFDDADLSAARSAIRMKSAQGVLDVHFAGREPAGLKSGDVLRVRGISVNAAVAAQDGKIQQAAIAAAAACTPVGNQSTVAILATFPGVTPPAITPASVYETLFGAGARTVDGYWREASYGKSWATGKVVGWYTLDKLYTCDQYYDMLAAAIRAADADVDFRNYSRVFVIFPNPGGCSWAGLSNVGCGSYNSPADGAFTASASWMLANYFTTNDQGVKLAVHEGGHGLGLMHSRSRDFGAEALGGLGVAGTLSEYGDPASAMGSWNLGHYTAEQKLQLGWLPATNVATVQSTGSYTVLPAETPAAGTQVLKIQRGTGNTPWLWLEYRQPLGNYDSTLSSQVFSGGLVHYDDATTGSYTDLLDFTTATSSFADPALAAGSTWVDPYTNLTLTVNGASAGGLNVSVKYGALPCVAAAPSISISPANPSAQAGASVNYTLTVKNNDSAGCSASQFTLGSAQPQGWATAFSSTSLTVSPGQTATATMTKTVPLSALPGTSTVDATAAGPSLSATTTASLTVIPAPPPLGIAVVASASVYAPKSTAVFTATVSSGSTPAAGVAVTFVMTKQGGAQQSQSARTDSAGKAVWSYRFGPKEPLGAYSVAATAVSGSQSATSSPVSFKLQ